MMDDSRTTVCAPQLKSRLDDVATEWQRVLSDAAARRAVALHEPALLVVVAATDPSGRRTVRSYLAFSSNGAPSALVVGAHSACDVASVHGAALRHVALWIDPSVNPGWVHAVDLNTGDGLLVDGEAGVRRVDARCSVRIGAGSADLLAMALVPGENVDVHMLPAFAAPFIPRVMQAGFSSQAPRRTANAPRDAEPASAVRGPRMTREGVTMVTFAPEQLRVGREGDRLLRLHPTQLDLERGFILGRYGRCTEQLEDERVSRVHALLVAHADSVLVIDTASTNGTDVLVPAAPGARQRQDVTLSLGIVRRAVALPHGFRLDVGGTVVEVR